MKIAFISDIHANLVALEAVLVDIASVSVDEIICLGDIASLGPQPNEVTDRIRSLGCAAIQGNHDPLVCNGQYQRIVAGELVHYK